MSNTYYNNDDIMQNIDKVADDVTAIKDIIINLAKDNIRLESKVNKLQIEQDYLIGMFKIINGIDEKKASQKRLSSSVRGLRSRKNIIGKTMQNLSGWPPDLMTITLTERGIL